MKRPTVLVTNDDGPPDTANSPFVYGLVQVLRDVLDWNVIVVLPSSQKSWIGKAYFIASTVDMHYFYPEKPDGLKGEKLQVARPDSKEEQWILLDGTPATCSSIALHNLYPGQIDLVVSGPNFGRNTSSAFALSSGTIGAAMSASLSMIPSIALSYGVFQKPVAPEVVTQAHAMSCTILSQLWSSGFLSNREASDGQVDVYSINVPLLPSILECDPKSPPARFTTMATSRYQRLFAHVDTEEQASKVEKAGPDAQKVERVDQGKGETRPKMGEKMKFAFKPDIGPLVNPKPESLIPGTDIHALHQGLISITPIRAAFASAPLPDGLASQVGPEGNWQLSSRL